MIDGYDFEIIDLGQAKYFNFYRIGISDGEDYKKVVIENSLIANTTLNGIRPKGLSMFIHMKCCLIFGTKLHKILDHETMTKIFKTNESDIEVGEIEFFSSDSDKFNLLIDNRKEKIYLNKKEEVLDSIECFIIDS
jgi:hypothetical protein